MTTKSKSIKNHVLDLKDSAAAITEAAKEGKDTHVAITPPNFRIVNFRVVGNAPFLSNAMSSDARAKMKAGQEEGTRARKMKRNRDPKDFHKVFRGSLHLSREGWYGVTASSFRNAMIDACRTVDMPMTRAKLFLFIQHDGYDKDDGTPLVRIHGEPVQDERIGKLAGGQSDILTRARFDEWHCDLRIKYDADSLTATDVGNLLARAGFHCGVGAGRPNSKNSNGIGMGTFDVAAS
jgi:hypothetical protein